uniref:30S ribosomal protein S5 n=1 Tax=Nephromyces sp. ex Molgula occidentalis TaxID=2544991 RepID=A0A5C1H7W0_9APIC|nr:30S ribosomal protein S5 [Nephromyces sp. ex Molgula occidentalis]
MSILFNNSNFINQKLITWPGRLSYLTFRQITRLDILSIKLNFLINSFFTNCNSLPYLSLFTILNLYLQILDLSIIFESIHLFKTLSWIDSLKLKTVNICNFNWNSRIKYKIIEIRKISKTTKKGQTKKFKICIASGNLEGWFGLGTGKHSNFNMALTKAYQNSLKNIFIIPRTFENNFILKSQLLKFKKSILFIKSMQGGSRLKASFPLKAILELAGWTKIWIKVYGSRNILNWIYAFCKGLKKQDYNGYKSNYWNYFKDQYNSLLHLNNVLMIY